MDYTRTRAEMKLFVGTKKVCKLNGSLAIVLDKQWALLPNDVVNVSIKKSIGDDVPVIKATKKITFVGNSVIFYCDKFWGLKIDDWVYVTIRRRDRSQERYVPVKESTEPEPECVFIDDVGV